MVLTIDIGNTNTIVGAYKRDTLVFASRIATDRLKTADEYAILIKSLISLYGYTCDEISGAIISSVVPQLLQAFKNAIKLIKDIKVFTMGPGIKTGLNIMIDNPAQLGSDLVCVSVAALEYYPCPSIVFDLGTATTVSALDAKGNLIGGAILAGVRTALDALCARTAQLPQISLEAPVNLVGTNTVDSMKAGAIIGTASMMDGMIARYREVLGDDLTTIATGGLSATIVPHCKESIILNEHLLLEGLYLIYQKNSR